MPAPRRLLLKVVLWLIGIAATDSAAVARGEYIYAYQAQCWGCHADGSADARSAPSGGKSFDLSGAGPGFGIWYTPNITPDKETGIGGWTDGEIVQAIREGMRRDRSTMFPVMPSDWYHGMSDEDALAVVAYLRSIAPVAHRVPPPEPSFVAKALLAFGMMSPKDAITVPVAAPARGATAEYGRYVASSLAGCLDCHTPLNLENGKFYMDSLGAGGTILFGDAEGSSLRSYGRNITPDMETGIGKWSEADFYAAVTVGMRPDGTVLTPHMPYGYFKSLTEDDLRALWLYIRSLPPLARTVPATVRSNTLAESKGAARGKLLFAARCQACHGVDGAGAPPTQVKLAEVAHSMSDADLAEMIQNGDVNLKMPSFRSTLADDELADLIAYLRTWKAE